MLVRAALLSLLVALAGCSADPAADPGGATTTTTTPTGAGQSAPVIPPAPVTSHLDWNGSLVAGAWVCDSTATHQCVIQPEGSFGTHHVFEGLVGNLTAGEVVLSWTVATPLTQELVIEAVVVTPDCDDCEATFIPAVSGPSPVTLEFPVGLAIAAGQELYVVVYSGQYTSTSGIATGTSGEQDFRVAGDLTLQP